MVCDIVEITLLTLIFAFTLFNTFYFLSCCKFADNKNNGNSQKFCCDCYCHKDENTDVTEDTIENSSRSRYYIFCVCTKFKSNTRVYKSFTTGDYIDGYPSAQDLETLCQNVLRANPEYKDCVITFFQKIKG